MHEMSLVQNLFAQLRDLAAEHSASKVMQVTMEIGPLAGIVIDSFQFGFDVLSAEDPLFAEAKLVIEVDPVHFHCTQCKKVTPSEEKQIDGCPHCDESFLIPQGGDNLILKQVQME